MPILMYGAYVFEYNYGRKLKESTRLYVFVEIYDTEAARCIYFSFNSRCKSVVSQNLLDIILNKHIFKKICLSFYLVKLCFHS